MFYGVTVKTKNTHEQLAFDNTATIAKRHFQGTGPNIVQKRAFPQRYTRESKTLERLKKARRRRAGLLLF